MIRTQIYLQEELHQATKLIAKNENKSMAEILRQFIIIGLELEQKKIKPKSLSSLANLSITEGPSDLSSNMDTYLYQE